MKNTSPKPPLFAQWLFEQYTATAEKRTIFGDIEEYFYEIADQESSFKARLWFWRQLICAILILLKNFIYWRVIMFKNYVKVALRNVKKHKGYSFINIAGLAVGMACCILIILYIQYEFRYDKYHKEAENIYRVGVNGVNGAPPLMAAFLKENFPEVVRASRLKKEESSVNFNSKSFKENRFYFVDQEFLDVFTFPLLKCDPKTALNEPFSLIITQEMATKYFGKKEPVGEVVSCNTYGKKFDYTVTGIVKNVPVNSHFKFDFLASIVTLKDLRGDAYLNNWNNNAYKTYIQLSENINPDELVKKIPAFPADIRDFQLQPLTDIHLHGNKIGELEPNSDIRYVYLFAALGFFILLIACFNYMNLSTARSARRAKEVGMRKVMGANRQQLLMQYFGESIILSCIALILSIFLGHIFLPVFCSLVDRNLSFSFRNLQIVIGLICTVLFVGLISGIYPAVFLSSFQPIKVLKNNLNIGTKSKSFFRNSLVVVQFVISVTLVICTLVIFQQINYIKNIKIGYNEDYVITALIGDLNLRADVELLKNELSRHPQITDVSASTGLLTDIGWINNPSGWEGKTEDENPIFFRMGVDYNFLDLYELELLQGRKFSMDYGRDASEGIILNETAVLELGWVDPIGKSFDNGFVSGVIKDFHFESVHEKIKPIWMRINSDYKYNFFLSIKIKSDDIANTLAFINKTWRKFSQDYPFDYSFVDDEIGTMYKTEQKVGTSFKYFTLIAIIIACLGLFGLASFIIEQKTREIGIRKVLGASVSKIAVMLSKEFIQCILIANFIAWPIAYFAMKSWLENFAYRINLSLWSFILSGILALLVALITLGYQAIKAAVANPVDALKYE